MDALDVALHAITVVVAIICFTILGITKVLDGTAVVSGITTSLASVGALTAIEVARSPRGTNGS